MGRAALSIAGAGFDAAAILAAAAAAGFVQQTLDSTAAVRDSLLLGGLVACVFLIAALIRGQYALAKGLVRQGLFRRTAIVFAIALLAGFAGAFILHICQDLSPVALLSFSALALPVVFGVRLACLKIVGAHVKPRGIAERKIFLAGFEDELKGFSRRYESRLVGTHVIASTALRGQEEHLEEDLALASASARILQPDDIFILVPWSQTKTIDACVDTFKRLPVAIHLGPDALLERFADAAISKVGPIPSLSLVRRPLSPLEVAAKRAMDIVLASLGILLLAPFFAAIAIAIKLDSPGPVIFRQRRYGFNRKPFRIFKFRSMCTLEDDSRLAQVVEGDERVTRFGDFMRRHNIDELPQLLNVLIGDMSLVGPRPHALAHDQAFERKIAHYSRRHNVKPGITGWAQVNGLRGIFSDEKMQARVEYDLYYIDNWSLWLDIKIIWLTFVSKRSYMNAY